jgi:hypothetical protein
MAARVFLDSSSSTEKTQIMSMAQVFLWNNFAPAFA